QRRPEVDEGPFMKEERHLIDGLARALGQAVERKRAEAETREAQRALLAQQRRATERAEAELATLRDGLVRTTRLAAIGQVSASIAHDIRNPLGSIRNAAYYLKRRAGGDSPEIVEYLGIIDQEVDAADRIITNLLGMARAKEPVRQDVDLGQLVKEAIAGAGRGDEIRCRMSLEPDPFRVYADPDQMRQVIGNLYANALDAVGEAGEFVVEARRDAREDIIVFRDSGPGVPEELRDTLFEPLVTTKAKGTGLGLTICRQMIEQHNGTVELIERDGQGAALQVRLPRRRREPAKQGESQHVE
ncbi:hypothetical protein LCGC14_1470470, partial [marine sediment metagenome]